MLPAACLSPVSVCGTGGAEAVLSDTVELETEAAVAIAASHESAASTGSGECSFVLFRQLTPACKSSPVLAVPYDEPQLLYSCYQAELAVGKTCLAVAEATASRQLVAQKMPIFPARISVAEMQLVPLVAAVVAAAACNSLSVSADQQLVLSASRSPVSVLRSFLPFSLRDFRNGPSCLRRGQSRC